MDEEIQAEQDGAGGFLEGAGSEQNLAPAPQARLLSPQSPRDELSATKLGRAS